jgi:hypothetical protein
VNTTRPMRGSAISGATAALEPLTTFNKPGGSRAASACSTREVASGAVGAGLTITALPATSA